MTGPSLRYIPVMATDPADNAQYELPRLARPVKWWEIGAVVVAWIGLLLLGWVLAHWLAVPLFVGTAASIVLGGATVGQLLLERWAGHVDGHLDTERRRKKVKRNAQAKAEIGRAAEANARLRELISTVAFWLSVATAIALGTALAGEAAEVGLTCFPSDLPFSNMFPIWQTEAQCK